MFKKILSCQNVFSLLCSFFLLGAFFIFLTPVSAATYVPGVINEPVTWTLSDSPYIVRPEYVNINSVLTIEPGVVVKFQNNPMMARFGVLSINGHFGGQLIASGTAENPIIFTSYYDDSYAGDTNEDGDATDPNLSHWGGLVFSHDNSQLDNVIVRYAGKNPYGYNASLAFKDQSLAIVNRSIIELSGGTGITVDGDAAPNLTHLQINSCALYAFETQGYTAPGVLSDSVLTGNLGPKLMNLSANGLFQFDNNLYFNNYSNNLSLTGSVTREVTWFNLGLPYTNMPTVMSTGIVHIEPGVVFKFTPDTYNTNRANVNGRLYAEGTAGKPIIFTSYLDDSVAGDSNGDGTASVPAPRDWGEINFENSPESVLSYVEIRYGGEYHGDFSGIMYATNHYDLVRIKNSHVIINHSVIEQSSSYGILFEDGSLNIQNSEIRNNHEGLAIATSGAIVKNNKIFGHPAYGLSYWGPDAFDATENWWGSDSGPTHPDNPGGTGDHISGNVIYDPWIGKEQGVDPVILIPGIMGSYQVSGEWKIDPILRTYDNLTEAMLAAQYEYDETLFVFAYDWRQSNALTASLLKQKIDEIKQRTGKSKVDIIAHSMGGLVARYYIQSNEYENDVDQVIFLGTPQIGAPANLI